MFFYVDKITNLELVRGSCSCMRNTMSLYLSCLGEFRGYKCGMLSVECIGKTFKCKYVIYIGAIVYYGCGNVL